MRQELAGGVTLMACVFQTDFGIRAKRQPLLLAGKAVLQPPPFATPGDEFEVQPFAVKSAQRSLARFGGLDLLGIERQSGVTFSAVTQLPRKLPHFDFGFKWTSLDVFGMTVLFHQGVNSLYGTPRDFSGLPGTFDWWRRRESNPRP